MGKIDEEETVPVFKIESDLPVARAYNVNTKIPWADMSKGDSVLLTDAFLATRNDNYAHAAAYSANARYPDRHFVARRVEGGYRIWRVK